MEKASNKTDLSTQSVCSIIETCARYNVAKLQFRDLMLEFGQKPEQPPPGRTTATTVADMTEQEHQEQTKQALAEDELSLREQQLEELKITDPAEYERQIRDGELEDDDADRGAESDDE